MNPRETILEEFMDEFEIEQSIPMDFAQQLPTVETVDETCGDYFKDPQCLYNRFKQKNVANSHNLAKISKVPNNSEVAFCFAAVPELYFHPSFSIRNPDTFQHIIRYEERNQELAAAAAAAAALDSQTTTSTTTTEDSSTSPSSSSLSPTKSSSKSRKSNEDTTLTNYLDLVEVALLKQIMTKSPAFFRALDDIYDLQSMVSRAATRVIHIRRHIRESNNSILTGPMRLSKLEQRRRNEIKLFEKAQCMQTVSSLSLSFSVIDLI